MTHVNFIVDCSGSMAASVSPHERKFGKYIESVARWEAMRHTVQQFLMNLQDSDSFSIIEFESNARPLVANMRANSTNYGGVRDIMTVIDDLDNRNIQAISGPYGRKEPIFYPRGGTNIPEALRVTLAQTPPNTPTINLLFTDMYDRNGDYIFNALMSHYRYTGGPTAGTIASGDPMLDYLMADGPLIVTIIAGLDTGADRSATALETKVNQYVLDKLSYKELQAQCKKMGVSAVGKKQDLIGRLQQGIGSGGFRVDMTAFVETFEYEVDYYSGLKDDAWQNIKPESLYR